jgi:hypothetical protein
MTSQAQVVGADRVVPPIGTCANAPEAEAA